jgi:hypothetical protein
MLLVLSCQGVATGWAFAAGNVQERWVAELLLSTRAGHPRLQGPLHPETHRPKVPPPAEWMSLVPRSGVASPKPMMTDSGFRGADWLAHWAEAYGAQACPTPQQASRAEQRWWSFTCQVVATTLSHVTDNFGLKYPGAHTSWGLLARVAAKVAAYNLGMVINRLVGRPDFACGTLIVQDNGSICIKSLGVHHAYHAPHARTRLSARRIRCSLSCTPVVTRLSPWCAGVLSSCGDSRRAGTRCRVL